ncbi:MAG: sigma-70 family RNA polymerase sigma factor [Hyphomonas sp.]|uniref:RNA polymerase sigma factor n=1 Tax=Hyphomonas sp. TaxID=87 RepID=UPI003529CD95
MTAPISPVSGADLASLLETNLPALRAYARGLCGNISCADDLVQDTFLRALENLHTFDTSRPIRPWLFRILRNEFLRGARRNWRRMDLTDAICDRELNTDESHGTRADARLMLGLLRELPEDLRDAVSLVLGLGFTYDEAAEVCGVPAGTIKSRASRGRASLVAAFDSRADCKASTNTARFAMDGFRLSA